MQRFLPQEQCVIVRGLLEKKGKVLIVPSIVSTSFFEYYTLPGGIVARGEDPLVALERWFLHHTNIVVSVQTPLQTIHRTSPQGDTQVIEIIYRVEILKALPEESTYSVMWVSTNECGYFVSTHISNMLKGKNTLSSDTV